MILSDKEAQQLLMSVSSIILKHDTIRQCTGKEFNIFSILQIEHKEVLICRFIRELLDPKGKHCQGSLYLKLFVKDVLAGLDANDPEWDNAAVKVEFGTGNGRRIDISIITPIHFIAIEAKIYAVDLSNQCKDYYEEIKKSCSNGALLYYLTLYGTEPSEESKGGLVVGEDIHLISWSTDIINWLEDCLLQKQTIQLNLVRENLQQLITTIKKFTSQIEDDEMMEIKDLIMSSPENLRSAYAVYSAFDPKSISIEKLRKIFQKIDNKVKVTREEKISDDYEKVIKKFYESQIAPSLNYFYKNIKADIDIYVRMDISSRKSKGEEKPAIGYVITKSGNIEDRIKIPEVTDDEIKKAIESTIFKHEGYAWLYLKYQEAPVFANADNSTIEFLIDDNKVNAFVESCASQINELLARA